MRPRRSRMIESTVSAKGRTTLPKPVRDALGVKPGDRVRYIIIDDEVRIVPMRPLARLFGMLEYDGPPKTLEDMERAATSCFSRIYGALKGTVTIPKETDLTSPAEADWDAER